jgi:hypothetical protein
MPTKREQTMARSSKQIAGLWNVVDFYVFFPSDKRKTWIMETIN